MTDDEIEKVRLALSDAEACFGYDHGENTFEQDARYEKWWSTRAEDAADTGATSGDVRRHVIDRLRAAIEVIDGTYRCGPRV